MRRTVHAFGGGGSCVVTPRDASLVTRYIENALEFLDSASEWYYDPTAGKLYFFYNGTGAPSPDLLLEVPTLLTILRVNASRAGLVR